MNDSDDALFAEVSTLVDFKKRSIISHKNALINKGCDPVSSLGCYPCQLKTWVRLYDYIDYIEILIILCM